MRVPRYRHPFAWLYSEAELRRMDLECLIADILLIWAFLIGWPALIIGAGFWCAAKGSGM